LERVGDDSNETAGTVKGEPLSPLSLLSAAGCHCPGRKALALTRRRTNRP